MTNQLPIIVFYKGSDSYLESSLKQAIKTNLDTDIYLIGDTPVLAPGITFINSQEFNSFKSFKPSYIHASHLSERFELLCIERWFAINEFIKQSNIDKFLHIDSDVLLFCNVNEEAARFNDYDLTINKWNDQYYMADYLQVNNPKILDNFCQYIVDLYNNREAFSAHYRESYNKITNQPWVSDMSLLKSFVTSNPLNVYYLENTLKDNIYFDNRLTDTTGFQKSSDLTKHIQFKKGVPYGYLSDGTEVQMKIIHYTGASYLIPRHLQLARTTSLLGTSETAF